MATYKATAFYSIVSERSYMISVSGNIMHLEEFLNIQTATLHAAGNYFWIGFLNYFHFCAYEDYIEQVVPPFCLFASSKYYSSKFIVTNELVAFPPSGDCF